VKPQFAKAALAMGAAALLAFVPVRGIDSIAVAQVSLPPVTDPLNPALDPMMRRTEDRLDSRVRRRAEAAKKAAESVPASTDELLKSAGSAADETLGAAGEIVADANGLVSALVRPFLDDVDPAGNVIEKDVVALLLDNAQLAMLGNGTFDILHRRELPSLGLTIVTLRNPRRATLEQAVGDLRSALPDAAIDFNHIYEFAGDAEATTAVSNEAPGEIAVGKEALRIGMIDSAVSAEHFSLSNSRIESGDFVIHEGQRPLGHGTAVASLIAQSSDNQARIFAASVFFQAENHAPGATTESLVAALDWLAGQQVEVINMSLSGPPNALLERALSGLAENGPLVVAAVGNNGPSGEPLYPAAYENVVGVTAIDRNKKIFRYANRGPQVDFAALGVDVKVADAGAGWRIESGTSMASPRVAVVIATARHSSDLPAIALLELLANSAEDLGPKGPDPVYGHGLIARAPVLVSDNPQ
jgi:subtilisin family serine protease